jgi:tetratricopeptide (TPR) repeat protein
MQARAEEAIPQYEAAIALAPHLAKSYYELAKLYNDTKQYDAAKLALEKTLDLQPDHLNAANDLQELRRSLRVLSRGMEIVRFPNRLDTFADMKSAIKDHVLGKDYPNILSPAHYAKSVWMRATRLLESRSTLPLPIGNTSTG